jgi:hypothetical protein
MHDRMHTQFWSENLKRPLGRPGVDWMTILKSISNKQGVRVWILFIWHSKGPTENSCEHGYEPLGSIKNRKFLN